MNTLPDLSQLTHEQLLEFTRQLAMQHQSLAQSNQAIRMPKFNILKSPISN
jgi:transposase